MGSKTLTRGRLEVELLLIEEPRVSEEFGEDEGDEGGADLVKLGVGGDKIF